MNDSRKRRDTYVSMWQSQMVSKHVASFPVEFLIRDVAGLQQSFPGSCSQAGVGGVGGGGGGGEGRGLDSEEEAELSDENGKGNQAREGGVAEYSCTESFALPIADTQAFW